MGVEGEISDHRPRISRTFFQRTFSAGNYGTHAFERAGLGQDLDRGNMKEWAKQMDEVWGIVVRRLREVHTR